MCIGILDGVQNEWNKMKVDEEITCTNCDAEFFIQFNEDDDLKFCPFCAEPLEDGYIEEDDDE